MQDFTFYAPTKVIFGKGKSRETGSVIKEYGFKKIMLQYGQGSIKKSGLYDVIMSSLRENGIEVVEFGGVEPNPKLSFAREAVAKARETGVQMILAVGGGSVLDSSKYTAAGALSEHDIWDFPSGKSKPEKALPVGCVLTIAAAGSEMSSSAVISNTELNMKRGFNSEHNRCLFAICDPELTYTVGKYQTACGIVDMMTHTMERYFAPVEDTEPTDSIAEALLKSIVSAAKTVMNDPRDYEGRATLMWASSLAHNDLTGCGRSHFLAVHQLEHALSGEYDSIAHGAGLAVLYPAWAEYVYPYAIPRFARFARNVWDVSESDDVLAAKTGIEKMKEFFLSLGMPGRISDFGIPDSSVDRLADLCTFGKTREIKSYVPLDYEKVREIFKSCW